MLVGKVSREDAGVVAAAQTKAPPHLGAAEGINPKSTPFPADPPSSSHLLHTIPKMLRFVLSPTLQISLPRTFFALAFSSKSHSSDY